jgi:hypothetical protein
LVKEETVLVSEALVPLPRVLLPLISRQPVQKTKERKVKNKMFFIAVVLYAPKVKSFYFLKTCI